MTQGNSRKRQTWTSGTAIATLAFAAATPALAHPGADHVHSIASGFAHPFSGFDHLLAMVAVGLWAGMTGGRAVWAWPLAFVSLMLVGGAIGASHLTVPYAETGILASVIVLGFAVTASLRAPTLLGALVIGAFALLHGYAHGVELPAGASAASYMAGFALATALLHSLGATAAIAAGQGAGRIAVRVTGAFVAVAGFALALA